VIEDPAPDNPDARDDHTGNLSPMNVSVMDSWLGEVEGCGMGRVPGVRLFPPLKSLYLSRVTF